MNLLPTTWQRQVSLTELDPVLSNFCEAQFTTVDNPIQSVMDVRWFPDFSKAHNANTWGDFASVKQEEGLVYFYVKFVVSTVLSCACLKIFLTIHVCNQENFTMRQTVLISSLQISELKYFLMTLSNPLFLYAILLFKSPFLISTENPPNAQKLFIIPPKIYH